MLDCSLVQLFICVANDMLLIVYCLLDGHPSFVHKSVSMHDTELLPVGYFILTL